MEQDRRLIEGGFICEDCLYNLGEFEGCILCEICGDCNCRPTHGERNEW
mgnify:FL=1|jgi:hypothetical protein